MENTNKLSENDNISDNTLPDENKAEVLVSVLAIPKSESSVYLTSQCGGMDRKFYVPRCGLVFYIMAFLSCLCAFGLRAGLSVAIVAMVNQTAVSDEILATNTSDIDQCPRDPALQSGSGEFVWDRHQQGAVLAAYFYGHTVTQVQNNSLSTIKYTVGFYVNNNAYIVD